MYFQLDTTVSSGRCTEGSVQLAGGTVGKNGRIEVCLNGVWGMVCSDGWGTTDAFIACKQLGMGEGSELCP